MTQAPLFTRSTVSVQQLLATLRDRGWVKRSQLALELHTTIRQIKRAAEESHGAVIAGNQGLKLTAQATRAELEEGTGRFRSQVRKMQNRIILTEKAWHAGGRVE